MSTLDVGKEISSKNRVFPLYVKRDYVFYKTQRGFEFPVPIQKCTDANTAFEEYASSFALEIAREIERKHEEYILI